jgi:transcriptional regulator of acetoin/glycerol metabolism
MSEDGSTLSRPNHPKIKGIACGRKINNPPRRRSAQLWTQFLRQPVGFILLSDQPAREIRQLHIAPLHLALLPNRFSQAEGIAAARARGVRFGRPVKKPPENFAALVKAWERGKLPIDEILERTGLKEATFYRRLREHRLSKGKR